MMARSNNALQAEAGYIDARPHQPSRGSLLHCTAGPYIRVKSSPAVMSVPMSGLPESGHGGATYEYTPLGQTARDRGSLFTYHISSNGAAGDWYWEVTSRGEIIARGIAATEALALSLIHS